MVLAFQDEESITAETGADGANTYPGDSGAPFLRPIDDGGLELNGVLSWGDHLRGHDLRPLHGRTPDGPVRGVGPGAGTLV